jgi:hypothetical protein
VREFEVYVPRNYNDGRPIPRKKIRRIKTRLNRFFPGVTEFHLRKRGWWKLEGIVYRDKITIFRIITKKKRRARRLLRQLKEKLKVALQQEEILIVERDVRTL